MNVLTGLIPSDRKKAVSELALIFSSLPVFVSFSFTLYLFPFLSLSLKSQIRSFNYTASDILQPNPHFSLSLSPESQYLKKKSTKILSP